MKKKIFLSILAITMIGFLIQVQPLKATDFSGNESKYNNICNGYISKDDPNRETCEEYKDYLIQKSNDAKSSISELNKEIASIGDDLDAISAKSKELSEKIESMESDISDLESSISNISAGIKTAQANIDKKEKQIKQKKADIKKRKNIIKERMVHLQVKANTNQYVNYIMGAEDLVDMIQRASSIETFTSYDKNLITELNKEIKQLDKEMAALEDEKAEQERLKETQEAQKQNLEDQQAEVEDLYTANETLEGKYRQQQATLIAERTEAIRQQQLASGAASNISFSEAVQNTSPSTGLSVPISGPSSAGTWAYPGGGLHLGLDKSVSIGTSVYAPGNGVVLSARTGVNSSGGGYLGNMVGYPYGGGNTLHILVNTSSGVYAISFFHLSPMIISTGAQISQGQLIAKTGNTGNSSGPHCHIEVFKLNLTWKQALNYWKNNQDWAWGCGWSAGGTCSSAGCRIRPESLGW